MNFRGIAIIALVFASLSAYSHEFHTTIANKAESPVDGSLWIGTNGEGIFRLGRNGKRVHYSVAGGQLSSDDIVTLGFDNNKVLWILDTTGDVTKYTSVTGFHKVLSIPDGICSASFSSNLDNIYICGQNSAFYSFDISTESLGSPVVLPSQAISIFPSVEDFSIWVFTTDGLLRISQDGSFMQWKDLELDSNLLPFEFDTNLPQNTVKPRNKGIIILVFIAILLLIALVSVLYRFLFFGRRINPNTEVDSNPVVEAESHVIHVDPTLSDALDTPDTTSSHARVPLNNINTTPNTDGKFTQTVLDLIDKNLSDPAFDVDSIASLTGLSRIHVNRKLKAEGSPSPSALLKTARMDLASKLLKEGKLTVREVSVACGFSRPSYFATAFKEYFNISPSDYQSSAEA
jgi:AraC-like DNA-binding protein